MANDLVPEGRYLRVDLDWGIVAHCVVGDDGAKYIAIRAQCTELGISVARQLEKISEDYPDAIRDFRLETAGGRQVTKCLRRAEAAMWLTGLHPSKVRKDIAPNLATVRAQILMALDRIVFGDMTDVRAVATIQPRGGEVHLGGCPKCRTELGVRFGPQGLELFIS